MEKKTSRQSNSRSNYQGLSTQPRDLVYRAASGSHGRYSGLALLTFLTPRFAAAEAEHTQGVDFQAHTPA